jgi:hypothetical protein
MFRRRDAGYALDPRMRSLWTLERLCRIAALLGLSMSDMAIRVMPTDVCAGTTNGQ